MRYGRANLAFMPRTVVFSIESPANVTAIHEAFSSEDYWWARLEAFGGVGRLDSLDLDPDGRVEVVVIHDVRQGGLPKIVAKIYPARWQVVQREAWVPVGPDSLHGEVSFTTHGAPGSGRGTAVLAPTKDGCRLDCTATVEFKVPLIGGKVEGLIGHHLPDQFSHVQRFTSTWIDDC